MRKYLLAGVGTVFCHLALAQSFNSQSLGQLILPPNYGVFPSGVTINSGGIAVTGNSTVAGNLVITDPSVNSGNSLEVSATNDTNGVNFLMAGNGAVNQNKTLRVLSGVFGILNNAYSIVMFSVAEPGYVTTANTLTVSAGGLNVMAGGAAVTGGVSSDSFTATGTAPTPTSCGTSPSVVSTSNRTRGTVTEGTTATGCTIPFSPNFATTPICVVAGTAVLTSYSVTAAALTLVNASATGDVFTYHCFE